MHKKDVAMKMKISAEVVDAKNSSQRCLNFESAVDFIALCDEREAVKPFVEMILDWICNSAFVVDMVEKVDDIVWEGNVATFHTALVEKKSALQRNCPMYRDMNAAVTPNKFLTLTINFE